MTKRLRNRALGCEDFKGCWANRKKVSVRGYLLLLLKLFFKLMVAEEKDAGKG